MSIIPTGFYGALLLFAALELARHGIKTDRYLITVLIAVVALITGVTLAFVTSIVVYYAWCIGPPGSRDKIMKHDQ